jgi:hypothetical protein
MLPNQCHCSCKLAVLVGAVRPPMLQSETNPEGTPLAAFGAISAVDDWVTLQGGCRN